MTKSYFDDQDLTAYVLDELSSVDKAKFEQRLLVEPSLQAAVNELRGLTSLISDELQTEPATALSADQRVQIQQAMPADGNETVPAATSAIPPYGRGSRMGLLAVIVTSVALVVAAIIINQPTADVAPESRQLARLSAPVRFDDQTIFSDVEVDPTADTDILVVDGLGRPTTWEMQRKELQPALGDHPFIATQPAVVPPAISNSTTNSPDANHLSRLQDKRAAVGSKPGNESVGSLANRREAAAKSPAAATVAAPVVTSSTRGVWTRRPRAQARPVQEMQQVPEFGVALDGGRSVYTDADGREEAVRLHEQLVNEREALLSKFARQQRTTRHKKDLHELKTGFARNSITSAESYAPLVENPFIRPQGKSALSTFSIDVDTASYSNMRRFVQRNQWPPANSVRIEELINYFDYGYETPSNDDPFSVHVEANPCPWNAEHQLVQIGLQGRTIPKEERPPINLVFLIDVSGSMSDHNKLPLVKSALELLVSEMTEDDRIAIVTYASGASVQLESTCGSERDVILQKIHGLSAGGSTNGEAGIQMAYDTAMKNFRDEGNNRVILCTDGDFNVGVSSDSALVTLIEEKAKSNVFLSIFGFGMGNLKDSKLEGLADKGNGHYAYIDGIKEANKVFVEEMTGTLFTIAKDVKIQVEFNPLHVGEYRLIGYENRLMAAQDFADDTKDAGEIGAGHRVTALYEVVPVEVAMKEATRKAALEPKLKYQGDQPIESADGNATADDPASVPVADDLVTPELLTVSLRYKQPDGETSSLIEQPVNAKTTTDESSPSPGFNWASAVATFGMVLRDSQFKGNATLDMAADLVQQSTLPDKNGHRREFADLIQKARVINARRTGQALDPYPKLTEADALKKAAVKGKYSTLLKTLKADKDQATYGVFKDFGKWDGTSYAGVNDLPQGYWVYVCPKWYIWESTTEQASSDVDPADATKPSAP